MSDKPNIFELAKYGLDLVEREIKTYKCTEFFVSLNDYFNIDIEQNAIKHSEIGTEGGLSVRIYNEKGSLGFAFTNILNSNSVENVVKTANKMMNVSTADPDFIDLPLKAKNYPSIKDLYDKNIENLSIEDSIKYATELINTCSKEPSLISQSANFTSQNSKTFILNSNGIETYGEETVFSVSSEVTLIDEITGEKSTGFDYQLKRKMEDIDGEMIATNALVNAKNNLHRIKIKSKSLSLILSPRAVIELILKPIASAVNAETYQYKRSFLLDKIGQKIGSDLLTIEDNALIDGSVGSTPYDDEGVICKNKTILEKGTFLESGLLHNSYTAGKAGIESSGNAMRASYSSLPSIGITNFILKPGPISKGEIFQDLKEGIFMYHTADSPNISTGDFSGLITQGNVIRNGEIGKPLNETMFGINLIDLLQKVSAVSKEYTIYGPFYAPYVKLDGVKIIGSAN
jgi:PmbA protein